MPATAIFPATDWSLDGRKHGMRLVAVWLELMLDFMKCLQAVQPARQGPADSKTPATAPAIQAGALSSISPADLKGGIARLRTAAARDTVPPAVILIDSQCMHDTLPASLIPCFAIALCTLAWHAVMH